MCVSIYLSVSICVYYTSTNPISHVGYHTTHLHGGTFGGGRRADDESHDHDDVGVHASFYSRFSRQIAKEEPEPVVDKVRKTCAFSVFVAIALLLAMVVFSGTGVCLCVSLSVSVCLCVFPSYTKTNPLSSGHLGRRYESGSARTSFAQPRH